MMSSLTGDSISGQLPYSLNTANDVSCLRLRFLSRLLAEFVPGKRTLELRGSREGISVLHPHAVVDRKGVEDLLTDPDFGLYEQIVWFNGLNWERSRSRAVLNAINARLQPGGRLFLSCAAHFLFVDENPYVELEVAGVCEGMVGGARINADFGDLRFSERELRRVFYGFRVSRYEHIEADVHLEREAFDEWHRGSLRSLFGQYIDPKLRDRYLLALHARYQEGVYRPRLGTTLIVAERIKDKAD